jgi:4-carboxymuconolactone decarboxylase
MQTSKQETGTSLISSLYGRDYQDALARLGEIAPDFRDLIVNVIAGTVYARPELDQRSRELVAIASLASLGHALPQLKVHVAGALALGWTRVEIIETLTQVAMHAGFPAARNAIMAAGEVFAAHPELGSSASAK